MLLLSPIRFTSCVPLPCIDNIAETSPSNEQPTLHQFLINLESPFSTMACLQLLRCPERN